jgi:hypothetical protein
MDSPLVFNRTKKQIGDVREDGPFDPGDPGHFTRDDVVALHYRARQKGIMEDEKLRWRVHDPYVFGANILCWDGNTITPDIVQRILNNKGWPDDTLVGVHIVYDADLPVNELHLEHVSMEGAPITSIGSIITNFELLQEGPE